MLRRTFLQGLSLAGLSYHSNLLAAPSSSGQFLLIFLRGGYDAANLLVPYSSSFYYESRPNLALAKPGSQADAALALDSNWGLHPALAESIYPWFAQKQLAFIPFAGTDDLTRSHFETQDSIEMGQPTGSRRNYQSGFLNRLAQVLSNGSGKKIASMSFTEQLPLVMQGQVSVSNAGLRNPAKNNPDQRQQQLIRQMYQESSLAKPVADGFATRDEIARDMQQEMNAANRNAISTKGFELEAERIGRMMKEKYSLGFLDVGGWDTHVNQGAAKGALANKFEELGRGLVALRRGLGASWASTSIVVISEFGRTFRENGKQGTDHGHGSVYWLAGGAINGGKIAGQQTQINANSLFQNRDYAVLNDYRALLGGLFQRQFALSPSQLEQVFAGVKAQDLGLL